ncbi:MAG: hypothetical protein ACOX78_03635 [Lachnospiraceae bacterium]|jgi:iron complex transport system substrate-binding protein
MKRKRFAVLGMAAITAAALIGCGSSAGTQTTTVQATTVQTTTTAQTTTAKTTTQAASSAAETAEAVASDTMANVTLEGGSGKTTVESPCQVTEVDGQITGAVIVWSSEYIDYMIVDGTKYMNENDGGNSTFTIPVSAYDTPIDVVADTTAMSTPHEIEYTLTFTKTE